MIRAIEKWVLPPRCVITHALADDFDLSEKVLQQLVKPIDVCPQCCEPSLDATLCGACMTHPPAFDQTQVAFYFKDPLSKLVYDLKYHQQAAYARLLVEMSISAFDATGVEALIPVPTHPLRRRERGYNQAELIAEEISKHLGIPVVKSAVQRIKHTPSQTHLTAKQRQQNLTKAFKIQTDCFDNINCVALVDDVITTGATMQALAKLICAKTNIDRIESWAIAKTK